MIRRTLWRPDTCGCALEYEWDDTVPQDLRTHTPVAIVATCAAHAGAVDAADLHGDLIDENPRKNRAEARLLAAFPGALGTTDPVTGRTILKPDAYTYTITGTGKNRVLRLAINYLSAAQKTAVQTWCDNNIGAGRVVVS